MVHVGSGVSVDDSAGHSPPAPALPPRRYRGEVDLTMVDHLPPPSVALSSRCVDTTNGESTLPHDTYANQLRRQARRYQHSRGSSFSHSRPPLPDWKPPPPPFLPPELPPPPASDEPAGRKFDSEVRADRIVESEVPKSWAGLASGSSSYATELELEKSSACMSVPDVESTGLSASEAKTTEVQQTTVGVNRSPQSSLHVSNSGGDQELGSSSSATYRHPEVDVVSGYDRYYSIGDHTTSLSRSFSSFIPSDSQSTEMSGVRRLSGSAVHLNAQSTKTSRSAVTEPPASSTTFSINSLRAVTVGQKSVSISDAGLPVGRRQPTIEDEVQVETTPSSEDPKSSSNIEGGTLSQPDVTEPRLTELKFFQRLKFPAEVDCSRQAEIVAGLLRRTDRDEALLNMLASSSGHRTATDFMAKVLGMVECEPRRYEDFPETLQLRLSARDSRHAAL